jgi:hypothetical protein
MTSEEQIGRLLDRQIADNARVDAALAALQIVKQDKNESVDQVTAERQQTERS